MWFLLCFIFILHIPISWSKKSRLHGHDACSSIVISLCGSYASGAPSALVRVFRHETFCYVLFGHPVSCLYLFSLPNKQFSSTSSSWHAYEMSWVNSDSHCSMILCIKSSFATRWVVLVKQHFTMIFPQAVSSLDIIYWEILLICQNTTMQVYGTWIKRYWVLC